MKARCLANSLYNVAVVLRKAGRQGESERYFEDAIRMRGQLLGPDHPDTAQLEMELTTALAEQNKLAAAFPHCARAHAAFLRYFGGEHPLTETTGQLLEKLPAPPK
jgi:hypothetical protein